MRDGKQKNKTHYFWQIKKAVNNFDTAKSQSKKTVIIVKQSKSFGKSTEIKKWI